LHQSPRSEIFAASGVRPSLDRSATTKEAVVDKPDIGRLEKSIHALQDRISVLAAEDDYLELIKIIHQPGWTTPAEFRLVNTIVTTFTRQVDTLDHLKQDLVQAAQLVGTRERVEA
jgi:hypothetical protein